MKPKRIIQVVLLMVGMISLACSAIGGGANISPWCWDQTYKASEPWRIGTGDGKDYVPGPGPTVRGSSQRIEWFLIQLTPQNFIEVGQALLNETFETLDDVVIGLIRRFNANALDMWGASTRISFNRNIVSCGPPPVMADSPAPELISNEMRPVVIGVGVFALVSAFALLFVGRGGQGQGRHQSAPSGA